MPSMQFWYEDNNHVCKQLYNFTIAYVLDCHLSICMYCIDQSFFLLLHVPIYCICRNYTVKRCHNFLLELWYNLKLNNTKNRFFIIFLFYFLVDRGSSWVQFVIMYLYFRLTRRFLANLNGLSSSPWFLFYIVCNKILMSHGNFSLTCFCL